MHMCMGVVLVGIMYPPPDGNYSAFFFCGVSRSATSPKIFFREFFFLGLLFHIRRVSLV